MLVYEDSKTSKPLNVIRKEIKNNMVIYHCLSDSGVIETLNQMQVITVRYYNVLRS